MTGIREEAKEEALKRLSGRKSLQANMTDEQKQFVKDWDGPVVVGKKDEA